MDSSEIQTHGRREGSAWNGHFECTCHHPLFCFNQFGDLERALLREGNVHSADNWRAVLEPVVARYRECLLNRCFRGDAAFAQPEIYEYLEGERHAKYVTFRTAEVAIPRSLFASILEKIAQLRLLPGTG